MHNVIVNINVKYFLITLYVLFLSDWTPNEHFSAISWQEQVTFNEMMMTSILYKTNMLIQ